MTPLKAMRAAVAELEKRKIKYCLVGGHAASLYRKNERVTKDVDFALLSDPKENSRREAEQVLVALGLKPVLGFIPAGNRKGHASKVMLITSTPQRGALNGVIDLLLPEMPWVIDAIERAQYNRIDLIFAKVPVITPEDLLIAKSYAFSGTPSRFQDLDDIKEIVAGVRSIDLEYLKLKFEKFDLTFPQILSSSLPKEFRKLCAEK